jgi:glycerol-3-phosphate acyltransferase PlsX
LPVSENADRLRQMKIALDAMGGDFAPQNNIEGAVLALRELSQISKLFLTGDTPKIEAELKKHGCNVARIQIVHTTQVVDMSDSGLDAVRKKRDSSISRAVELVKSGEADAVVSAGHTGAAVAAATIKLRMLPGIDRPAIAALMPTETGKSFILCDAGANPDATAQQIEDNAIMALAYCEHVLERANPKAGLMSNGTEEYKGNALTQAAYELLRASGLNFHGNVEGHDIFEGVVDVVVTDGFTGNVILKTSEALAKSMFRMLKRELTANPIRKAGALLCKPGFLKIKAITSADEGGGMPLLGVNGVVIISHGGASAYALKNAIRMACATISHNLNPYLIKQVQRYHEQQQHQPQATA